MTSSSDAAAPATNPSDPGPAAAPGPDPVPSRPEPAAGFDRVTGSMATAEFGVAGMHCDSCVALIEEALTDRAGVRSAAVDRVSGRATVGYDPSLLDVGDVRATIEEAGYSATPVG